MQRFGNSWRVTVYISDDVAEKLREELKATRSSASGYVAGVLQFLLCPEQVEQG